MGAGRLFTLRRHEDATGISGTGDVADGIEFPDGNVAMRWRPGLAGVGSTCTYESIADVVAIHGHNGKTEIAWES